VKPEENTKRQSQFLDDHPGLVAKKFNLNWRLLDFLHFKGVDDPD